MHRRAGSVGDHVLRLASATVPGALRLEPPAEALRESLRRGDLLGDPAQSEQERLDRAPTRARRSGPRLRGNRWARRRSRRGRSVAWRRGRRVMTSSATAKPAAIQALQGPRDPRQRSRVAHPGLPPQRADEPLGGGDVDISLPGRRHGRVRGAEQVVRTPRRMIERFEHLARLGDAHARLDQCPDDTEPLEVPVLVRRLCRRTANALRKQRLSQVVLDRRDRERRSARTVRRFSCSPLDFDSSAIQYG